MFRKTGFVLIAGLFIFSLTGCATCAKKTSVEVQGLKNEISVLESQVQSKDEEINSLKESLAKAEETRQPSQNFSRRSSGSKVKSRPNVKQIQVALKNAGYNPGEIDGKMGAQTREAIKSFQKDNSLAVDGSVGKRTWEALRKYLDMKVK